MKLYSTKIFGMSYVMPLLFVVGVKATTYATFYSDPDCTKDASVDFSVNNPGCFNVGGNEYVKYHGTNAQCFSLVKSPDAQCSCQFECITGASSYPSTVDNCGPIVFPNSGCFHIGQSQSLRFIGGSCGTNNCPDRHSRSIPTLEDDQYKDVDDLIDENETPSVEENNEETNEENNEETIEVERRDYGPPGVGYYRFCKDEYCTLDCSINFRTTNPGCIAGDGFKSIQFNEALGGPSTLKLVATPHGECSCQSDCWAIKGNSCIPLPDSQRNQGSYRMIQQDSCDANNC